MNTATAQMRADLKVVGIVRPHTDSPPPAGVAFLHYDADAHDIGIGDTLTPQQLVDWAWVAPQEPPVELDAGASSTLTTVEVVTVAAAPPETAWNEPMPSWKRENPDG